MSERIDYQKAQNKEQAFQITKENITEEKIEKFKVQATLDYNEPDLITASGKGFKVFMNFHDDHCTLELELSFLLKALRGKISGALERELKKVL